MENVKNLIKALMRELVMLIRTLVLGFEVCRRNSEALWVKLLEEREVLSCTFSWRSMHPLKVGAKKVAVCATVLTTKTFSRTRQRSVFSGCSLFSALFAVLRFFSDNLTMYLIYSMWGA
jgi:hypothetical protein